MSNAAAARTITMIAVRSLRESPTNPRKTFGKMKELEASVRAQGIISPLIVRAIDKGFEIIAGHRRFRAAKEAGLAEVPCEIVALDDRAALEVQLTENLQRQDLTDLEEAENMDALMKTGLEAEQVAQRMGVSIGTVYSRLKLLALCSEAKKALADGELPGSVAVPLARIPAHALQAKALKEIRSRFLFDQGPGLPAKVGAREAIEFLQRDFCRALRGATFDLKDAMLITEAGPCTACPKNSKCATPGLFDDFAREKGQAFCTDVKCFDAKVAAAWAEKVAGYEGAGAKVLSAEEGAKLFPHGELTHGSKYIELDKPNHADKQKRAWREFWEKLPAETRPQLIVAPDRTYAARELVEGDKLREALAEAPGAPKWAKAEVARAEKTAEIRAEMKEAKAESSLRERAMREALRKIGDKLPANFGDEVLRFILIGLAERWIPSPVLEALQMENRDVYEKRIAKASSKELRAALLMWGAFNGDLLDASDGYPAPFKALAKAADLDVKLIEKAIEDGDAAEALMKKPAKGGAK